MDHFQGFMREESYPNLQLLPKVVVLKKYARREFIYHFTAPEGHCYLILKGRVGCFVPKPLSYLNVQLNLIDSMQQSKVGDLEFTKASEYLSSFRNKNDENLLEGDLSYSHLYFSGSTCLFHKIKSLEPGQAFGGFTSHQYASFVAEEDTSIIVIPRKKYQLFFPQEVFRFEFVTSSIADFFCSYEKFVKEKIEQDTQAQESLSNINQLRHKKQNRPVSPPPPPIKEKEKEGILDQVFAEFSESPFPKLQEVINVSELPVDISGQGKSENENKDIQPRSNKIVSSSIEEKKKCIQRMLSSTDIFSQFTLQRFDSNNQIIFSEGDSLDDYFLVVQGKVVVKKKIQILTSEEDSRVEYILKEYLRGDLFGFEDEGVKRTFSCQCDHVGTQIFRIKIRDFDYYINNKLYLFFKQIQRYEKKVLLNILRLSRESTIKREVQKSISQLRSTSSNQLISRQGIFQSKKVHSQFISEAINAASKRIQIDNIKSIQRISKSVVNLNKGTIAVDEIKGIFRTPRNVRFNLSSDVQVDRSQINESGTSFEKNFELSTTSRQESKREYMNMGFTTNRRNRMLITPTKLGSESLVNDVDISFVKFRAINNSQKSMKPLTLASPTSTSNGSFERYSMLSTFSNTYHKQKNIITVQRSIERTKDDSTPKRHQMSVSLEKLRQNNKTREELEDEDIINGGIRIEVPSKENDLLKQKIERQIMNIPKFYQDKLWGKTSTQRNYFSSTYNMH